MERKARDITHKSHAKERKSHDKEGKSRACIKIIFDADYGDKTLRKTISELLIITENKILF